MLNESFHSLYENCFACVYCALLLVASNMKFSKNVFNFKIKNHIIYFESTVKAEVIISE